MPSMFNARDADNYERLMGRWSRRLAPLFIEHAGIADGENVIEVGCGSANRRNASPPGQTPPRLPRRRRRQSQKSGTTPRRSRHRDCAWRRHGQGSLPVRRCRRGRKAGRAWSSAGLSSVWPRRSGTKMPRSRAGQGSFQNSRPFSGLFNVAASRSAQITTMLFS